MHARAHATGGGCSWGPARCGAGPARHAAGRWPPTQRANWREPRACCVRYVCWAQGVSGASNYFLDVLDAPGGQVAARVWVLDASGKGCGAEKKGW